MERKRYLYKGQWSFLKGNVQDSFDFVPRLIKSEESFFISSLLLTDYSQETQIDVRVFQIDLHVFRF